MNKKRIGFIAGILVFIAIELIPLGGLSAKGKTDLA